ncbi:uncharacterized protein LOC103314366 [Tribolium castaneum]|uniref:G-protein coupled receptors family 1 profile domain-containing protein n=1 Tax=Tribolium castaneum TaxID=7070 RepID=D6X100_TRICA|nr:PREDICTED: uncharacterized protein LOC103314366 [Tribolium castaneum]EFA10584.1 hypothetical protein TcasGA2_TC012840 [Tribolium castaneum]|eukprot:XP_008198483.1 PREDICTED: uncharacterized protein LOC103314366 [Tribolium castaneum]
MSVLVNETYTEDEIFGDLATHEESSLPSTGSILQMLWNIIAEGTKLVICVLSAVSASFLIYIILKFEKVRKKCNIFLLHYAISSLIDVMLVPLVMLMSQFAFSSTVGWEFFCFIYSINSSTNILVFVFGSMIGFYWFIQNFKNSWIKNQKKFELFATIFIYIVCSIKLAIVGGECFVEESLHTSEILRGIFLILLLIITGINIVVKRKSLTDTQIKSKYELAVSSYIIYSFLPLFVIGFSFYFTWSHDTIDFIFYFYTLAEVLAFSGTPIITYILYQKSKHFRVAFNSIFKRSVKHYDEEELNEESEEEQPAAGSNNNSGFI